MKNVFDQKSGLFIYFSFLVLRIANIWTFDICIFDICSLRFWKFIIFDELTIKQHFVFSLNIIYYRRETASKTIIHIENFCRQLWQFMVEQQDWPYVIIEWMHVTSLCFCRKKVVVQYFLNCTSSARKIHFCW